MVASTALCEKLHANPVGAGEHKFHLRTPDRRGGVFCAVWSASVLFCTLSAWLTNHLSTELHQMKSLLEIVSSGALALLAEEIHPLRERGNVPPNQRRLAGIVIQAAQH